MKDNLLAAIHGPIPEEIFEPLLRGSEFRLERIVSKGHVTPPGNWYDQDQAEWVLLLSGAARLRFEGETELFELQPGEFLNIPAHRRHRVEWTDPDGQTVWLALHYTKNGSQSCVEEGEAPGG
jgi:cupin 2 domain-containing protein